MKIGKKSKKTHYLLFFSFTLLFFCIACPIDLFAREIVRDVIASRAQAEKAVNSIMSTNPGSCNIEINTSERLIAICLDRVDGWLSFFWQNGQLRVIKLTDQEASSLDYTKNLN